MKSILNKSVLCLALSLSIASCVSSVYKETSSVELKDIILNSQTEDEAKQTAFKALTKRADKGELDAFSALITIKKQSNSFDDQIEPYVEEALDRQFSEITTAINNAMVYPEIHNAGKVIETRVRVELNADGSVKSAGVSRSSGFPEFDNASTKAVNDAGPFSIIDGFYEQVSLFTLSIDSEKP